MGFKLDNISTPDKKKPRTEGSSLQELLQKDIELFGRPFSNKVREDFYTELSVLLQAGITLREALELIREGQKKEKLKTFYSGIVTQLVAGQSFASTVEGLSEFTPYEAHSIRIGEESGTLTEILKELGDFYARKNEQKRNLINALTYPIIILVTAVLVVVFMLRLVVPMFQDIFRQNQVDLPWITEWVIGVSEFLGRYGLWIVLAIVALLVSRRWLFKDPRIKRFRDYGILRIPAAGGFVKAVYLAQFTRAMSLLTASRVPMLNGIELASEMIAFAPLREALDGVKADILQGKSLSESMKSYPLFDPKMVSLVRVAEETNQTEFIFQRLNEQYSISVQQKSKLLSTLLEPLIILIVGILVGVILISMYLPMFRLGSVLG